MWFYLNSLCYRLWTQTSQHSTTYSSSTQLIASMSTVYGLFQSWQLYLYNVPHFALFTFLSFWRGWKRPLCHFGQTQLVPSDYWSLRLPHYVFGVSDPCHTKPYEFFSDFLNFEPYWCVFRLPTIFSFKLEEGQWVLYIFSNCE